MFRFVGHYLLDSGPCVFNMQSFSQISRGFCLAAQARPQAPLPQLTQGALAHLSVLSACLPCSQFVAVRNNMADILTISHFLALLGPTSASAKCNSHLRPYMSCLM